MRVSAKKLENTVLCYNSKCDLCPNIGCENLASGKDVLEDLCEAIEIIKNVRTLFADGTPGQFGNVSVDDRNAFMKQTEGIC